MHIARSRLWHHPAIIRTIVTCGQLDPFVILQNPAIFLAYDKDTIYGFCSIVSHGQAYELKSVYVYPPYRGGGVMQKILSRALPHYTPLYLICRNELATYYYGYGFHMIRPDEEKIPLILKIEHTIANFFAKILHTEQYLTMHLVNDLPELRI